MQERLGECPYFTEWQARGGDSEGERWGDRCVCPDRKRGVFCHLDYQENIRTVQSFNTTRSEGVQHLHVDGVDYLIELSFDSYNYTDPDTGTATFQISYEPKAYRYDVTTQRYEFFQLLDKQDMPRGTATFTAAGRHYVVVSRIIYVFNATTGLFDLVLTLNAIVGHVSALKRRSGEVVLAFADYSQNNASSLTLFWWPQSETMRRKYLPVPGCWTLKLFEVGSELFAAATSYKDESNARGFSSVWRWNGTDWEMSQTLEQTNCLGVGLDVMTWRDVIYLAVACPHTKDTHIFIMDANDRIFSHRQTLNEFRAAYRPGFVSAGGQLYIVVPNFSHSPNATMMIYRQFGDGSFVKYMEMPSHASYGVSVFQQHHDVYVYIWRRLNPALWQDGATMSEHLSRSPLIKWV